jgi:threonylcarbamoyladenosine tRNA methylthiotransferase MtaB
VTRPEVITLGCRLNLAESETMRRLAHGQDDLVIVNSCAVTNEAVKQTRQAIRRAKRARPDARVLVTGCAAEIDPAMFEAMPEVDGVVGNAGKLWALSPPTVRAEPVEALPSDYPRGRGEKGGLRQAQAERGWGEEELVSYSTRTRAFVGVQNGCDHRCTFCIIPYGRGPSRSVPAGLVIDRIKALVDGGSSEVVLTGVDVTSYGPDLPGSPTLGLLVERILRHVPRLRRLRLSSLDSVEIDDRLAEIITGEPRFMPHLHMSLQAGDDMILKRMKRRHSRAQAIATVQRLKAARPEIAIGADLIAGFPTETEAMAANSLTLIDECDIVMAHIFPYSARSGTPAARMPQLAPELIRARAARLREAAMRRKRAWLHSLVGTRQRVLFEKGGLGHAENFAPVRLAPASSSRRKPGAKVEALGGANLSHVSILSPGVRRDDVVGVRITGVENDVLIGDAA